MKFEQHWPRSFREEVLPNSQHFSHKNVWGPYKCKGKQTWPCFIKVTHQHTINFSRSLVPDDLCKDSAPRHPLFWRSRFLKVFTIYGHGDHFSHCLSNFFFPILRRLQVKFEQNWLSHFKRGRLKFSIFFPHKCMGAIQMHREANYTLL